MKLVLILIFTISISAAKRPLSFFIPICDPKDENLNKCVVDSANLLIPILARGIKDYGFPPLEPLKVDEMDIGQRTGAINLEFKLKNTSHHGLSTMRFYSASIDTTNNTWILNGTLPEYLLKGQYFSKGKVLLLPLEMEGNASFLFKNTGIDFVISVSPRERKGILYYNIDHLRVYFKFNKAIISLSNLFKGNTEYGNKFLNEHSLEIVNEMKSTFENLYSVLYKRFLGILTGHVPYLQFFKNDK